MKVSLNWLKKYVDIDNISVKRLADGLTLAGLEVEGVRTSKPIKNICIAQVRKSEKHPNANKLSLCTVFDGENEYQVVCGAPNVAAGQTIVFAKIGAILPGNFKIKEAEIRGVKSYGMICSERELGLSDEHNGIMVLEGTYNFGEDANKVLGIEDTILEIGVTPNRGDCLSIYGIARDVSAIFNRALDFTIFAADESEEDASDVTYVKIKNIDSCPYYTARVIKGVKVGPSPLWMQKRLRSAGMRPINNVVDVTNYVMIEYGQPLHAFDLRNIKGGIVVRNANAGESLVTLDGKARKLDESILTIADEEKVIGVAGVMGGEYSGVNEDTVDLVLECAFFNPEAVSDAARKLGINSDASYRYIRGVDAGSVRSLVDYAADLISSVCGGRVLKGVLSSGSTPDRFHTITASKRSICKLLGKNFSAHTIASYLQRLGMTTNIDEGDELSITVPSHRRDIEHSADIAEEVARLYGINKFKAVLPKFSSDANPLPFDYIKKKEVRHMLAALGFTEAVNYSFMSNRYLALFDDSNKFVTLKNPISEEMDTLRTYVYPGLIKSLEYNWNQGDRSLRMFELATSFVSNGDGKLPKETSHLAFAVMDKFLPDSWVKMPEVDTFYYIKSVCESIFKMLRIDANYVAVGISTLHPGKSAKIYSGKVELGFIGALHPDLEEQLDVKAPIYIVELNFENLIKCARKLAKYKPFSRLPSVYKDISIIISESATAESIIKTIKKASPLIQEVNLFDKYTSKDFAQGETSVAFRIWFSSLDKTLTDEEVNPLLMNIAKTLNKQYGAKLR